MSELCAKLDQYIETKRKELEALGQNTGEFEVCACIAAYGDLLRTYVCALLENLQNSNDRSGDL